MSAEIKTDSDVASEAALFVSIERLQDLLDHQARLSAEISVALRELANHCEARFGLEEHSPLYSEIAATAPWLAGNVERMVDEHRSLRMHLAELRRTAAGQLPLAKPLERCLKMLQAFRCELAAHEEGERELCFQAYMTDVGSKD